MVRVERVVTESNEGESSDYEEIDIKLEEENATNENNENVIEINNRSCPFLFQIVLDLKKKMFFINDFPKISKTRLLR